MVWKVYDGLSIVSLRINVISGFLEFICMFCNYQFLVVFAFWIGNSSYRIALLWTVITGLCCLVYYKLCSNDWIKMEQENFLILLSFNFYERISWLYIAP